MERDRLEEQAQSAALALGQTRSELRALAGNLMKTQEEERRRIERELHDGLGQQAALLGMLIERVAALLPTDLAAVTELRNTAAGVSAGLRSVSHQLHPAIIEHLGLPAALNGLVEQEQSQGRDVRFHEGGLSSPLPLDAATALYRIAQEALHNAARHAAGATVEITLAEENREVVLEVKDNGSGFSPLEVRAKGGLGLLSMQERARLAGGNLLLKSRPGEGTVLLVRWPLGE